MLTKCHSILVMSYWYLKELILKENNTAIGITVYSPNQEELLNIKTLYNESFQFLYYLNSEIDKTFFNELDNVEFIGNGTNDGLGVAINSIAERAYQRNFKYLLILDQDTKCNIYELMQNVDDELTHFQKNAVAYHLNSKYRKRNKIGDFIINSSTVFDLENFKKLGGMSSSYFLDGLDYDFCLRSWDQNMFIYSLPMMDYFDHNSLQDGLNLKIFNRKFNIRKYSQSRYKEIELSYRNAFLFSIRRKFYRAFMSLLKSYLIFKCSRLASKIIFIRG